MARGARRLSPWVAVVVAAGDHPYWWNRLTGETTLVPHLEATWCATYCFEQRAWFFWMPDRRDLASVWQLPDIDAASSTERPAWR